MMKKLSRRSFLQASGVLAAMADRLQRRQG